MRDHPRVCGEHAQRPIPAACALGSSPRMRGTLIAWCAVCAVKGDHPRVCGEHLIFDRWPVRVTGSSPRMRGTPTCADYEIPWRGIIPAYAGNTITPVRHTDLIRDHPRVCGEHRTDVEQHRKETGSSPRMRGTLADSLRSPRRTGIIPAYAGNTRPCQ